MSIIQISLFILATLALFYLFLSALNVSGLVAKYGHVILKPSLKLTWLACLTVEVLFVLSLTQGWGK